MGPLDREVIDRRLLRLEGVVRRLDRDPRASVEKYLADEDLQARVERRLQVASQICLDVANYLVARGDLEVPEQEENVFVVLAAAGVLEAELGQRMRSVTFRRFAGAVMRSLTESGAR